MDVKQEYEVHLTVQIADQVEYQKFNEICVHLDAKPLEIILARGKSPQQIMLSKVSYADDLERALVNVQSWVNLFKKHNLEILRTKIEMPFAQYMLSQIAQDYYEWHGLIEYQDASKIEKLCQYHQVHLSYNALKHYANLRFLTLREFGDAEVFLQRLHVLKTALTAQNQIIYKERLEACVYDTRVDLDQGWLNLNEE